MILSRIVTFSILCWTGGGVVMQCGRSSGEGHPSCWCYRWKTNSSVFRWMQTFSSRRTNHFVRFNVRAPIRFFKSTSKRHKCCTLSWPMYHIQFSCFLSLNVIACRHDIIDLERQLSEQVKSMEQLQASVAELSAKVREHIFPASLVALCFALVLISPYAFVSPHVLARYATRICISEGHKSPVLFSYTYTKRYLLLL